MSHSIQGTPARTGDNTRPEHDSAPGLQLLTAPAVVTGHACPQPLIYQLPLDGPGIRTSQARRRRLIDSLGGGNATQNADVLARDPHFWDYLQQVNPIAYDAEIDTRRARHFINRGCSIRSRHDLERSPSAAQRFKMCVERPFLAWLNAAPDLQEPVGFRNNLLRWREIGPNTP